jgi:hypothetical protein
VGKPNDNTETKAAKKKQIKRQVSAIKTILLVSGTYFMFHFPFVIIRLVLYGTVSAVDLETRRYPAVTLLVRCAWLAMVTVSHLLNPILYLSTRKKLKAGLFVLLPWLHNVQSHPHQENQDCGSCGFIHRLMPAAMLACLGDKTIPAFHGVPVRKSDVFLREALSFTRTVICH